MHIVNSEGLSKQLKQIYRQKCDSPLKEGEVRNLKSLRRVFVTIL